MKLVGKDIKHYEYFNKNMRHSLRLTIFKLKSFIIWFRANLLSKHGDFFYIEEKNKFQSELNTLKGKMFANQMPVQGSAKKVVDSKK